MRGLTDFVAADSKEKKKGALVLACTLWVLSHPPLSWMLHSPVPFSRIPVAVTSPFLISPLFFLVLGRRETRKFQVG
jgi:hypothetical protein